MSLIFEAEELIARLNPSSQSLDTPIYGQRTTIDAHHIAAAIALISAPDGAKYLARIRYAGQDNYRAQATWELYKLIKSKYGPWQSKKTYRSGLFTDIACLAVHDYVSSQKCMVCKGQGSTLIDDLKVECPNCRGNGVELNGMPKTGEKLGFEWSSWRESRWKKVYLHSIRILQEWDGAICRNLRI